MKKFILVATNAKFIHFNPAVYSIRAYSLLRNPNSQIDVMNFTINQDMGKIVESIYEAEPDVIGFSCYIWNISVVKECVKTIKKILPEVEIWLGGPEVSYCAETILNELPIRGVMVGEGEATFSEIVGTYESMMLPSGKIMQDEVFEGIKGIVLRTFSTPLREPMELDELPFFYEGLTDEETCNHILYYESSRGCPYSCSYCLSSLDKTLRFKNLEKVFHELDYFLEKKVRQVKFVDRTFNCKREHAMAIWQYIKDHDNGVTNFHFEIASENMTDEELELLASMRPNLVRLEIGVQSTNPMILRSINRCMDIEKLKSVSAKLLSAGNFSLHLDLIAGLPGEDINSFINSFNEIYLLHAHELQLGFLKVLKGTQIEAEALLGEIVYSDRPPYEVLSTKVLSYGDVRRLKAVEEMLEIYYNSGQFKKSIAYLEGYFDTPFELYEALAEHYKVNRYDIIQPSRVKRYDILLEFYEKLLGSDMSTPAALGVMKDCLLQDLYSREKLKKIPAWAEGIDVKKYWSLKDE